MRANRGGRARGGARLRLALGEARKKARQGARRYGLVAVAAFLAPAAGWPAAGSPAPDHAASQAGTIQTLASSASLLIPGGEGPEPQVAPLRRLRHTDVIVVSSRSLPAQVIAAVRRLRGVRMAEPVDAARVAVNGKDVAVLGVDPSRFRSFAARPTAADTALWRSVAGGDIALSYTMGRQDKLPVSSIVTISGRQRQDLPVGGLGTVGIGGVDGIISHAVARSLGFPAHNALVISAPHARLAALTSRIKAVAPASALVEPLAASSAQAAAGRAGGPAATPGYQLTQTQAVTMLKAAISRLGMPYVWGAAGPDSFDCSGLVQWSFARAGVVMPRVAADQARTGPFVRVSHLQPGDLLFYHTDPTAPSYISHVAIYLGHGLMIQAPEPGASVEVVPLALGSEYAGAVSVAPRVAAAVAGASVG